MAMMMSATLLQPSAISGDGKVRERKKEGKKKRKRKKNGVKKSRNGQKVMEILLSGVFFFFFFFCFFYKRKNERRLRNPFFSHKRGFTISITFSKGLELSKVTKSSLSKKYIFICNCKTELHKSELMVNKIVDKKGR